MMRLKRSIEYTALALSALAGVYVACRYIAPNLQVSPQEERTAPSTESFSTEFQGDLEGRTK